MDWTKLLEELAQPFPATAISWRAGAVTRDAKRAQALPYAEPRVYEDRLNEICPGDWSVNFKPWGDNRIICELTIHGVLRSSTGEENEGFAPGTAAEAQAFKRACSKFGLGRYLYDIPIAWVDYDAEHRRLIETPNLPAKFLPTETLNYTNTLSPERADAMKRELEKLGYSNAEQLKLSAEVLGRSIKTLTQISEAEALDIWTYAKRRSVA